MTVTRDVAKLATGARLERIVGTERERVVAVVHCRFGLAAGADYDAVAALSRRWQPYGGLVYFHLLLDALASSGHLQPSAP